MKNNVSVKKGKFYLSSVVLHLVLASAFALAISQSESLQNTFTEISEFQLVNSGQKTGKIFSKNTKTGFVAETGEKAVLEDSNISHKITPIQEPESQLNQVMDNQPQNLVGNGLVSSDSHSNAGDGVFDLSDSAQAGSLVAKPKVVKEVKAQYPAEAKSARVQGVVSMQVWVDEVGQVVRVDVLDGPSDLLNEAAKSALMQFRFTPAMTTQGPRKFKLKYKYRFKLENQ